MFDIVKNNTNNTFYSVKKETIEQAELNMGKIIPEDLRLLYREVGYGFLKTESHNINRIMGPSSIEEFALGTGQFENFEEVEFYSAYTKDKLVFFEVNESLYLSIGTTKKNNGKIYYYDEIIADNIDEFFTKYLKNEKYFLI